MELLLKNANEAPFEDGRDFRVVILCEDAATTDKASEVVQLLGRQLKSEAGRLLYQWWNFEFLATPELWGKFSAQAAGADVIIIGLHERLVFPEKIAAWLQLLPGLRKMRPGALVAVLDPGLAASDAGAAMVSQLKQAAALSRLDFFTTRAAERVDAEAIRNAGPPARLIDPAGFREAQRRRYETPFQSNWPLHGINEEPD